MSIDTTLAWVVAFLVVTVAVSAAARRVGWSAPLALVVIGVAVSYVPGVPRVDVEPDFVLSVLLPPLLFAAALQTSLSDVRARRESLLLLSVGLVAFTTVVVGLVTWAVVPTLTLAAAFAFGAVVAPTDAVAVSAVTRRAPLPRLLASILDGESLLNDATALVALNTAVVAVVAVFDPVRAVGEFVLAVVGGIGIGLLVVGGVLVLYGLGFLLHSAMEGLATAMPLWLAALIVGGALVLVAGTLAFVGVKQLQRGVPPTPTGAVESIKEDVATIKEGLRP